MIFVTVGGQLPFDRLIRNVDELCGRHGWKGMAQIGTGNYTPRNLDHVRFIPKDTMQKRACECRVIVGHAAIGTILTAVKAAKPLILVARRADLGEHRNEHQSATIREFADVRGLYHAEDQNGLDELLSRDLRPIDLATSPERLRLIEHLQSRFAQRLQPQGRLANVGS